MKCAKLERWKEVRTELQRSILAFWSFYLLVALNWVTLDFLRLVFVSFIFRIICILATDFGCFICDILIDILMLISKHLKLCVSVCQCTHAHTFLFFFEPNIYFIHLYLCQRDRVVLQSTSWSRQTASHQTFPVQPTSVPVCTVCQPTSVYSVLPPPFLDFFLF